MHLLQTRISRENKIQSHGPGFNPIYRYVGSGSWLFLVHMLHHSITLQMNCWCEVGHHSYCTAYKAPDKALSLWNLHVVTPLAALQPQTTWCTQCFQISRSSTWWIPPSYDDL